MTSSSTSTSMEAERLSGQKRSGDDLLVPENKMLKLTGDGLDGYAFVLRVGIYQDNRGYRDYAGAHRVISLLPQCTLKHLHQAIRVAFSWSGNHLHEFKRRMPRVA